MSSNRIRAIREARAQVVAAAFTISAVARRVGVTEAALRRWENGSATPRQRHAKALARELGVTVADLALAPSGAAGNLEDQASAAPGTALDE